MSSSRKKVSFSPDSVSSCTPVLDSKRRTSILKKTTKLDLPDVYESPTMPAIAVSMPKKNKSAIIIAEQDGDGICKGDSCYRCPKDLLAPLPKPVNEISVDVIEESNPMLLDFICTAKNCGALWVVKEKHKNIEIRSNGIKKAPSVLSFKK